MDEIEKIKEIYSNPSDFNNKELLDALTILNQEYEKTKYLIIDLTKHLDTLEEHYQKIQKEYVLRNG